MTERSFRFLFCAEKMAKQGILVEGNEGVEIGTASVDRFVQGYGEDDENRSDDKPPDLEKSHHDNEKNAHEFEGVTKLKGLLGVVGNGDERHVE